MFNANQLITVLTVGLVALTGCNSNTEQGTTTSTSSSSPVSTTTSTQSTSSYGTLLAVVAKTKTATETGDFAAAKKEFDGFEASWSKVEDGIKQKSSKSYDAIEKSMDDVDDALKESKPVKTKVLAALQSLEAEIKATP